MRIVLATPLYPPDMAASALYIKELSKRLGNDNEVMVVAYTNLPETVPGVRVIAVSKRHPLFIRLFAYFVTLVRIVREADVLYAENGASIELPVAFVARLANLPLVVHRGDTAARAYAQKNTFYGFVERLALARARTVIEESPLPRPEIMPFGERPVEALAAYERSWEEHVRKLSALFGTYAKH